MCMPTSSSRGDHTPLTMHPLTGVGQLDDAIEESKARPVLVFKHSVTCGISAYAASEIESIAADLAPVRIYQLVVQTSRVASQALATRLGVRHQSPQVILLWGGAVSWTASHHRVNAGEILGALRQVPGPPD